MANSWEEDEAVQAAKKDRAYWQRWAEWVLDQPDAPEPVRGQAERVLDAIASLEAIEAEIKGNA